MIIARQQAHLVGLAGTTSTSDIMFPSICSACDGFEDKDNTTDSSSCRTTQNSYQLMKDRLGTWDPAMGVKPSPFAPPCTDGAPPLVWITDPSDGATVPGDYDVKATAADDCGISAAHIDVSPAGLSADSAGTGPYLWSLTSVLGTQVITVTVTDVTGKKASASITVNPPPGYDAAPPESVIAEASDVAGEPAGEAGGDRAGEVLSGDAVGADAPMDAGLAEPQTGIDGPGADAAAVDVGAEPGGGRPGGCGCATAVPGEFPMGGSGTGGLVIVAGLLARRRRRRVQTMGRIDTTG